MIFPSTTIASVKCEILAGMFTHVSLKIWSWAYSPPRLGEQEEVIDCGIFCAVEKSLYLFLRTKGNHGRTVGHAQVQGLERSKLTNLRCSSTERWWVIKWDISHQKSSLLVHHPLLPHLIPLRPRLSPLTTHTFPQTVEKPCQPEKTANSRHFIVKIFKNKKSQHFSEERSLHCH